MRERRSAPVMPQMRAPPPARPRAQPARRVAAPPPGNHDAVVAARGPDRFETWRPWLGDEDRAAFPQLRRRGPLALINLCSARPTALHLAQGALDEAQMERLPGILRETGEAGLFRV